MRIPKNNHGGGQHTLRSRFVQHCLIVLCMCVVVRVLLITYIRPVLYIVRPRTFISCVLIPLASLLLYNGCSGLVLHLSALSLHVTERPGAKRG